MLRALAACSFLLSSSLALASQSDVAGARSISSSFQPDSLTFSTGWKGPHFVQARQDGQVVLLRAQTYETYPLEGEGLDSPVPLESLAPGATQAVSFLLGGAGESAVVTAAMSAAGDWLIVDGGEARLFRGGKEVPVTSPEWLILSAGWMGDDPVIGGTPRSAIAAMALKKELPSSVPILARWDGDR